MDCGIIFGDRPSPNGIVVLRKKEAETPSYRRALKKLDRKILRLIIREDLSFKTFFHFFRNNCYLKSTWTKEKIKIPYVHIEFLAVRRECQGQGIGSKLLNQIFNYAGENGLALTLETHKKHNVELYRHYGFEVLERFRKYPYLEQYNMAKECPE